MEKDEDEVLPDAPAPSSPPNAEEEPEEDAKPAADADKKPGQIQLADIFDDDDDDDEEFPGSSAVERKAESSPPEPAL